MITDVVRQAGTFWRDIARLAMPQDASVEVVYGKNPKSQAPFEAFTDNKKIFININDEGKLEKDLEKIVLPVYSHDAAALYGVANHISKAELLPNLGLDAFLFIHFHEELHPRLCPTDKRDQRKIAKALYEGLRASQPLPRAATLRQVNNCKNLIWDTVLNVSYMQQVTDMREVLAQKVSFVFGKRGRVIERQPFDRFPHGIVPIIYMMSAANSTTDIPISLMGAMYATMSYNASDVRKKALDIFFSDLRHKNLSDGMKVVQAMYKGLVHFVPEGELHKLGMTKKEFASHVALVDDIGNAAYEANQAYLHRALTRLFDTPGARYAALKGLAMVLQPFISLDEKQGSPDGRTQGTGDPDDSDGDPKDGSPDDDAADGNSMGNTLDDLLDELDPDEADKLAQDAAKDGDGTGGAGPSVASPVSIAAADQYYKKNAEALELRNPTKKDVSVDLGPRHRWKLTSSVTLTSAQVAQLNHKGIITFQAATKLPVLMELGQGSYRLNSYQLQTTHAKSFTTQLSGIELPDNWVLIQDSSSSMGGGAYVGSGSKFDRLNHVKYGLMKGLYTACKLLGKDMRFGVVDFSDITRYEGLDSLIKVYDARHHPIKDISLTPQSGNTKLDLDVFARIRRDLTPGKTIYTMVTDGALENDASSVLRAIQGAVAKDAAFVLVEIGVRSPLGVAVDALSKTNPAVLYRPVGNVKAVKDKLGSILVKYS